jgi:hypothetical protein
MLPGDGKTHRCIKAAFETHDYKIALDPAGERLLPCHCPMMPIAEIVEAKFSDGLKYTGLDRVLGKIPWASAECRAMARDYYAPKMVFDTYGALFIDGEPFETRILADLSTKFEHLLAPKPLVAAPPPPAMPIIEVVTKVDPGALKVIAKYTQDALLKAFGGLGASAAAAGGAMDTLGKSMTGDTINVKPPPRSQPVRSEPPPLRGLERAKRKFRFDD